MKKTIITIWAICVLVGGLLLGCSKQEEARLSVGRYEIEETTAIISPYIQLEEDNRFRFCYSTLSSYLPVGKYTLDGSMLTLATDDKKYHYVFYISGDQLLFQKEQSSGLTVYADEPDIEDGAAFTYQSDH